MGMRGILGSDGDDLCVAYGGSLSKFTELYTI